MYSTLPASPDLTFLNPEGEAFDPTTSDWKPLDSQSTLPEKDTIEDSVYVATWWTYNKLHCDHSEFPTLLKKRYGHLPGFEIGSLTRRKNRY